MRWRAMSIAWMRHPIRRRQGQIGCRNTVGVPFRPYLGIVGGDASTSCSDIYEAYVSAEERCGSASATRWWCCDA